MPRRQRKRAGPAAGGSCERPGIFVILRRSAFFGDAVAHASLAGIAVVVAIVLARIGRRRVFATFDPDGAHAAGIDVARLLTVHHVPSRSPSSPASAAWGRVAWRARSRSRRARA